MKVLVQDIISFLSDAVLRVEGNANDVYVDNVADPAHTTETTLDWVNSLKTNKQDIAENTCAKVVIADSEVLYSEAMMKAGKTLIVVKHPRMALAKVINEFFFPKPAPGIHPRAWVDPDAVIAPTAHIEAGCSIGKAKIGSGTVIRANVVVYDDVEIGDNCLIQAGAVIGTDGLGCNREEDGTLIKFPHMGGIKIGNNVEIGANCQIAKGVLSDTIIKDGCKMNGLSFIAHNCVLEENVWITGDTMLCGSTHVGKNATIFSNVIVREQSQIGAGSIIGMGSVVTKNVPEGETWFGAPAHKK